jgi:hypothetical protein
VTIAALQAIRRRRGRRGPQRTANRRNSRAKPHSDTVAPHGDTLIVSIVEGELFMAASHKGECFCGAVQIEVSGEPEGMGYCHCRSCRSWSGGPVNAFTLWKPDAVKVTAGAEHVATFRKTEISERQYCSKCGGHLMARHPTLGLVDVFAATLPTLEFSPGLHVNYAETVLPMRDGLPKLRDFPAEFGGSGEIVAE